MKTVSFIDYSGQFGIAYPDLEEEAGGGKQGEIVEVTVNKNTKTISLEVNENQRVKMENKLLED